MNEDIFVFDDEKLQMVNKVFSAVLGHPVTFTPECFEKPASFTNCGISRVKEAYDAVKADPDQEYDYDDVENYLAFALAEEMVCDHESDFPICYEGELDWLLNMIPDNAMLDWCQLMELDTSNGLDSAIEEALNKDRDMALLIYCMQNGVDNGKWKEEFPKDYGEERE